MNGRELVVLMGAPGSGKTFFSRGYCNRVSTDMLRGAIMSQGLVDMAFRRCWDGIAEYLKANSQVVFDTTAADPAIRRRAVGLGHALRATCRLVIFRTDVEECVRRQLKRSNPVPEGDVRRIHAEIEGQLPALSGEGWDAIEYR